MVFVRSPALVLSVGILLVVNVAAQPPKPEKASAVVPLDEDNFEQQTKAASGQSNGKWFVKFYAEWCGHCKRLAPIWDELAEKVAAENKNDNIVISKVDVPANRAIGDRFQVRGYPSLKLFADGKMYDYKGARKLEELYTFVTGGYQSQTPAGGIPGPPSWFSLQMKEIRQLAKQNKHLQDIAEDFTHILDFRKNAAALLFGIGLVLGIFIGYILGLSSGRKAAAKGSKAKSD